jgi:hypothetical protein
MRAGIENRKGFSHIRLGGMVSFSASVDFTRHQPTSWRRPQTTAAAGLGH